MKTLIINVGFAGKGFNFIASDEPIEVSGEVAEMAINAGFAVEVKPASKPKAKTSKSKKKAD